MMSRIEHTKGGQNSPNGDINQPNSSSHHEPQEKTKLAAQFPKPATSLLQKIQKSSSQPNSEESQDPTSPSIDITTVESKNNPQEYQQYPSFFREESEIREPHGTIDLEYQEMVEDREIGFIARRHAIRGMATGLFMAFIIYISIGVAFYSYLYHNWPIVESLVFIIYTMTTVGYGNHPAPPTALGKVFTTIYLLVGISILTVVVAAIIDFIILKGAQARSDRDGAQIARKGKLMAAKERRESNISASEHKRVQSYLEFVSADKRFIDAIIDGWKLVARFLKQNTVAFYISKTMPLTLIVAFGAITVGMIEGWSVVDSIYFSVVSITTVGYGDITPTKQASNWLCIFWLPFSLYFMSLFLSNVAQVYQKFHKKRITRIERHLRKIRASKKANMSSNEGDIDLNDSSISCESDSMNQFDTMTEYLEKVKYDLAMNCTRENDLPQDILTTQYNVGKIKNIIRNNSHDSFLMLTQQNTAEKSTERRRERRRLKKTVSNLIFSSSDNFNFDTGSIKPKILGSLRVLVEERLALIIEHEILCQTDQMGRVSQTHNFGTINVTLPNLKKITEKWLIPRRARESFACVAIDILMTIGKEGLISGRLFELRPLTFHRLFLPVMAAMEPPSILETWLASTEVLFEHTEWNNTEQKTDDGSWVPHIPRFHYVDL